jgi:hypothetical protein
MTRSNVQLRNSHQDHFPTAEPTLKERIMFGKQYLLTRQLITSAALAVSISGVALADDSSMNPSTGDSPAYFNGRPNRGNLNMAAQNPCPQGAESAGTREKKDEQKIESKILPANRGTPITSPTYFNQYPGQ